MTRNFTHEIGAAVQKSPLILASPNGLMIFKFHQPIRGGSINL